MASHTCTRRCISTNIRIASRYAQADLHTSLLHEVHHRQIRLQLIEALQECHRDHPIAKFWGHCNDQKIALDACFREEKKLNRYAISGVVTFGA